MRYVFIVTLHALFVVSSYPQGSYVAISSPLQPAIQVGQGGTAPSILVVKSRRAPPILVVKSRDDIEKIAFFAPLAARIAASTAGKKLIGSKVGQGIASQISNLGSKLGLGAKTAVTKPKPPISGAAPAGALDDIWEGQTPEPPTSSPTPTLENPPTAGTSMADAGSSKPSIEPSVGKTPNVFDGRVKDPKIEAARAENRQNVDMGSLGTDTGQSPSPMHAAGSTPKVEPNPGLIQRVRDKITPSAEPIATDDKGAGAAITDSGHWEQQTQLRNLEEEADKTKRGLTNTQLLGVGAFGMQALAGRNQAQQAKLQADQQQIQQLTQDARGKADTTTGGQVAVTA